MIAFERFGQGEPVVFLHGMGHRRQAWTPLIEFLAPHHELILIDLPGHGESSPLVLNRRNLFDVMHDELTSFFNEQGLGCPHLVGNSLGGRISLELSSRGCARSVTALAPAAFWETRVERAYSLAVFMMVAAGSQMPAAIVNRLLESTAMRSVAMAALMNKPGKLSAINAQEDLAAFRSATPTLVKLHQAATQFSGRISDDIPVTIAWAENDRILLNASRQAERARALLPHSRHLILPGCGHIPVVDSPELVAKTILETTGAYAKH